MAQPCPNCGYIKPGRVQVGISHADVVADYLTTNSATETARHFNISREYVRQIVKAKGITPRSPAEAGKARRLETDAKIAALHNLGLSNKEIQKSTGFSTVTIIRSLARQGLQRNRSVSARAREALRMFDAGLSIREITQTLGYKNEAMCRSLLYHHGRTVRARVARANDTSRAGEET